MDLLSRIDAIIAQRKQPEHKWTDEERAHALMRAGFHHPAALEEIALKEPCLRELVDVVKAEVVKQQREEFEGRQRAKQTVHAHLTRPTAEDLALPETEPADQREAARRAEKRGHRWWEPVRKMIMGSGELSEEAWQEQAKRDDKEAAERKRIANRKADWHASQVAEERRRQEILARPNPTFDWMR